jgi:hypothetical protein
MLQDSFGLILFDRLGHHVQNIVHNSGAQLEIEMRLHALLCHRLGNTFAISPFELTSEEVAKPEISKRTL